MLEKELTVAVLSQDENLLGYLDTDLVEIKEENELYKLRNITLSHPLFDPGSDDNTKYKDILLPGNKLWRTETCDGVPCLYVILGEVEYNYIDNTITVYAEEAATELSQWKVYRNSAFSWKVNSSFITTYLDDLFTKGTLSGPGTTTATSYNGALTAMSILRKIEEKTGGEFQFRYKYNPVSKEIIRYIDYLTSIGTTHTTIIDMSYNALNIELKINETETRIAAAPIGSPSNETDEFHKNMKAFEDQAISTSVQIPLYVTQDDSGNPVNGPMVYPPYNKGAGENFVECDDTNDIVANYNYIHVKEGSSSTYPRIYTFDTSETNKYNIYWECVDFIRQYLEPEINIECNVVDLEKLDDTATPEYYNVGDTVYINLPVYGVISARITSTTKDPRHLEDDSIGIGNYQTGFIQDRYKSAGMIDLNPS
jgi:hypothetical protein